MSFQPSRKKIFCIFTTSYFACPAQDSPLKTYWENEKKISLLGQVSKMFLLTFLPILFTTFMYLPKRKMNTFFFTALIQNPCIDLFLVRMLRLVSKSLILQQKNIDWAHAVAHDRLCVNKIVTENYSSKSRNLYTSKNMKGKIEGQFHSQKMWKEYFPNLLETALLCQSFVYWIRDFKYWLLAYFLIFFNCAKFQQDWTTLILDIL